MENSQWDAHEKGNYSVLSVSFLQTNKSKQAIMFFLNNLHVKISLSAPMAWKSENLIHSLKDPSFSRRIDAIYTV